MKILICGGTGQLGSDCTNVLKKKHEVIALSSSQLDITNPVEVKEMMRNVSPSMISCHTGKMTWSNLFIRIKSV
ncbi:MAG: sugar nucleotide-binding protein [Desulfobacterales bacterium]